MSLHVSTVHSSLFLSSIPFYGCTIVCFSIAKWTVIWIFSNVWIVINNAAMSTHI